MKLARIGEMHTKITVKSLTTGIDADGYPTEAWTDVFGGKVWCNWKNAHGTEVYDTMRLDLKEVATITMRYSDKVTPTCRIWREAETGDANAYEIISIDNVGDERKFLEIKVKRRVVA